MQKKSNLQKKKSLINFHDIAALAISQVLSTEFINW